MSFFSFTPPQWMAASFPYVRIVMMCLMVLVGIALIIVIMFTPSSSSGMGALTGQRDTFYSKDKSKSLESVMKRITVVLAIIEVVFAILFFVSLILYAGTGL